MRLTRLALQLGLTVLLLGGCGRPTEIVLLGASDLPLTQIGAVEIVVTSSAAGAVAESRCVCLSSGCASADPGGPREGRWPISVSLRPGRSEDPPFTVEMRGHAGARCDDAAVLTQAARARFRAGHRLLLRMSLDAACLSRSCDAAAETCREGACVPIDFPLEAYDNGPLPIPPSPDLASTPPDLASADLADADLAAVDAAVAPPPDVVLAMGVLAPSPPAIARAAGGYVITTCQAYRLEAYFLSDADVLSGPVKLWKGCRDTVAPATAIDGAGNAVTMASLEDPPGLGVGSGFVVHGADPGAALLTGPTYSPEAAPADQVSVRILAGAAHLFNLTAGGLRKSLFPSGQYVSSSGDYEPGSYIFMATAIASSGEVAIWRDDNIGVIYLRRDVDLLTTVLEPLIPSPAPSLLAAASTSAMHFGVLSAGPSPRSLKFASAQLGPNFNSVTFRNFDPPIQVEPSALTLTADHGSLLLAYSDGSSIFEMVLAPTWLTNPSMPPVAAPALIVSQRASVTSMDGLAYAPSNSPGGGRYVWREFTAGGGQLRSQRRNSNLP